ncbi:hypothetical protein [Listeria booriae]|uniref:Uncharacterized protein n=1 Tax=Listeria booriae TaxID=1552123 RepID=A0A841ZZK5_9LIST|nr:hypothetical protein [Listeria booriae]MBC1565063.1 hypothetical protein [Listeria booriae]
MKVNKEEVQERLNEITVNYLVTSTMSMENFMYLITVANNVVEFDRQTIQTNCEVKEKVVPRKVATWIQCAILYEKGNENFFQVMFDSADDDIKRWIRDTECSLEIIADIMQNNIVEYTLIDI